MENIIAVGVTFVLGIGGVGGVVTKHIGRARKAVTLAKEAFDVMEAVLKAVEDKNVDEAEIKQLIAETKEAKAAFIALVGK